MESIEELDVAVVVVCVDVANGLRFVPASPQAPGVVVPTPPATVKQ